uniref:Uncharacterized protein n=1 Tax=Salix viminalis TaxID=40686 RepID=A0A6N2MXW4_SALVM
MDSLTSINGPGKRLKGGGKQSYCLVNPRTDCRLHNIQIEAGEPVTKTHSFKQAAASYNCLKRYKYKIRNRTEGSKASRNKNP